MEPSKAARERDRLASKLAPALLSGGDDLGVEPGSCLEDRDPVLDAEIRRIVLAHRKRRRPGQNYATQSAREAASVEDEIQALVGVMPEAIVNSMIGGEQTLKQVPSGLRRREMVARVLRSRAGTAGAMIAKVRLMLGRVRVYAAEVLGLPEAERDAACFPMSAGLAHELIAREDERARKMAKGAKGGASVGDHLRETLIFAADVLKWPIESPSERKALLQAAAPKATAGVRRTKCGTLPLAFKCQLEALAAGACPEALGTPDLHARFRAAQPLPTDGVGPPVAVTARDIVVHFARSFLAAGLDHSLRVGEGMRVELQVDAEEPAHVMRALAWIAKDGSPLECFAPAEGILGEYEWLARHLAACEASPLFPAWEKTRGAAADICRAKGWRVVPPGVAPPVATKAEVRAVFKTMMRLPPLSYTDEEIKEMNLQGHSTHASPPDWGRALGETPLIAGVELPAELAVGFSDRDIDVLGHWLRNQALKAETTAEAAAIAAPAGKERRSAAIASMPGKAASKGAMRNYYGQPGDGSTRVSERFNQLRVRQRLTRIIRAILRARFPTGTTGVDWRRMPRGQADLRLLASTSSSAAVAGEAGPSGLA